MIKEAAAAVGVGCIHWGQSSAPLTRARCSYTHAMPFTAAASGNTLLLAQEEDRRRKRAVIAGSCEASAAAVDMQRARDT